MADSTARQVAGPFQVGVWVHCSDRNNFGQVMQVGDGRCDVRFYNREKGWKGRRWLDNSLLTKAHPDSTPLPSRSSSGGIPRTNGKAKTPAALLDDLQSARRVLGAEAGKPAPDDTLNRMTSDWADAALAAEGGPGWRDSWFARMEIEAPDQVGRYREALARAEAEPGDGDAAVWTTPRLAELPPAPAFPTWVFPPPLQDFCQEAAKTLAVAPDIIGTTMLAVAGAAIGQSVNIRVKRTWTEAAILYLAVVARPGKAKTPAIRRVTHPLSEIDDRLRKESWDARRDWEKTKRAYERSQEENLPPGPEPPYLRAIVKDITRESLALVLRDNPRGVLCDPDELAMWVGSMNEYKAKGGSDLQFWLSAWSASSISVDRKGGRESIYVPFPYVSVVGGLPPAVLGSISGHQDRGNGFFDRILCCYPDDDAFPSQRWTEAELSEESERAWADVIEKLHTNAMASDESGGSNRPHFVSFSEDGKRAWVEWFNAHAERAEEPDFSDSQAGAWSKSRAYAARFALILSQLRRASDPTTGYQPGPAEARDVEGAAALAEYFAGHWAKALAGISGGLDNEAARIILKWIRRHGKAEFRQAEVKEHIRGYRDDARQADFEAGLSALIEADVIRPIDAPEPGPGRKPSPAYAVNPAIVPAPENPVNSENGASGGQIGPIIGIGGISGRVEDDEDAPGVRREDDGAGEVPSPDGPITRSAKEGRS